jgi:Protein of unknown function (DUF2934)
MTEKAAKPVRRRTRATKPKEAAAAVSDRREPTHSEISERAYFIAQELGGSDEVGNWLRAERELVAA